MLLSFMKTISKNAVFCGFWPSHDLGIWFLISSSTWSKTAPITALASPKTPFISFYSRLFKIVQVPLNLHVTLCETNHATGSSDAKYAGEIRIYL